MLSHHWFMRCSTFSDALLCSPFPATDNLANSARLLLQRLHTLFASCESPKELTLVAAQPLPWCCREVAKTNHVLTFAGAACQERTNMHCVHRSLLLRGRLSLLFCAILRVTAWRSQDSVLVCRTKPKVQYRYLAHVGAHHRLAQIRLQCA